MQPHARGQGTRRALSRAREQEEPRHGRGRAGGRSQGPESGARASVRASAGRGNVTRATSLIAGERSLLF